MTARKTAPATPAPKTDEKPTAPATEPTATVTLGETTMKIYRPTVVLPDGTKAVCPHSMWGHPTKAAATACAKKLSGGVKIA